jgi:predicted 2-oxoglutarate/Fe(II)-dependent dioxygenase YbiX
MTIAPDTKTAGCQAFIKANAELFSQVNDEMMKQWRRMMHEYAKVPLPTNADGSPVLPNTDYHMFVLNWDAQCGFHIDKGDVDWGLCVVIPFGEFTGGELIFPELGQVVHLVAGDIMAFPSALLVHGNAPVLSGLRHSLVFTCCANNFHKPYSKA